MNDRIQEYVGFLSARAFEAPGPVDMQTRNPDKPGYVVCVDGKMATWLPQHVFEADYQQSGRLGFEHALFLAKNGKKVARVTWRSGHVICGPEGLMMITRTGQRLWRPTHADMLATDWRTHDA
jgi:hypothetical protein